jgi:hypothetical protein
MIIFDLRCFPAGHVFEAWFGSSGDYEDQRARGLVSCPLCGAAEVAKAPMAPAVPKKGGSELARPELFSGDAEKVKQMLGALATMQKAMLEKSDWVGARFADEARAIHVGDAEARPIHGQATRAETESLLEEGVPVAPLLIPIVPPEEQQ